MILLDTHIWIWWVHGDPRLTARQSQLLQDNERGGLGVSIISCWETAKLAALGRLTLPVTVDDWMSQALSYPGIRLFDLTPQIAIESTRLPGSFHRDPADQIIVATARVEKLSLFTADGLILNYPHGTTLT